MKREQGSEDETKSYFFLKVWNAAQKLFLLVTQQIKFRN